MERMVRLLVLVYGRSLDISHSMIPTNSLPGSYIREQVPYGVRMLLEAAVHTSASCVWSFGHRRTYDLRRFYWSLALISAFGASCDGGK